MEGLEANENRHAAGRVSCRAYERVNRFVLGACGLGLSLAAALLLPAELAAALERRTLVAERTPVQPREMRLAPARSLSSQLDQMVFCLNWPALAATDGTLRDGREAIPPACLARANEILMQSATRSVALLVKADAHLRLGNGEAAREALMAAKATGPREGWMAVRRVRLALQLSEATASAEERTRLRRLVFEDVALLTETPSLVERLAVLYLQAGAGRDFLVAAIERQPASVQAAFLQALAAVRNAS